MAIGERNAIGANGLWAALQRLVPERTFCYEISGSTPVGLKERWDWLAFDIVRYKTLKHEIKL